MGIRPSMSTIFGIDDFTPGEAFLKYHSDVIDYDDLPPLPDDGDKGGVGQIGMYYELHKYNPKTNRFEQKSWYDLIWQGMYDETCVIGYITASLPYESEVVRAMGLIDNKYTTGGHTVIPAKATRPMVDHMQQPIDVLPQHRYQQNYYSRVEKWIKVTQYLFRTTKMDEKWLDPANMKWMLVWQWS